MFNMESWSPVVLQVYGTVADPSKFYFNPVISPDGEMYVVIVTDKVNDVFSNPRLEIRSMEDNNVLFSKSLSGFDPEKFFIDDWVVGKIVFAKDEEN